MPAPYADISERIRGSIVALVTPMASDGSVDFDALERLVEWHISSGTHGISPAGTTGESSTLSHEEHIEVVRCVVSSVSGRVPVIAGSGSNSTSEAVSLTRGALSAGADAVLVVAPYYNRPTSEGMVAHYSAVSASVDLPIVAYNVPSRTSSDLAPDVVARIVESCPSVIALKDATSDLSRVSEHRRLLGGDFIQLSGEDDTALAFMAHGGVGCISVTANVAPSLCSSFQEACLGGRFDEALRLQDGLHPLHRGLFCESSPSPTKYALSALGRATDMVRPPLLPASSDARRVVDSALRAVSDEGDRSE